MLPLPPVEKLVSKCLLNINETKFGSIVFSLYECMNMGEDYAEEGLTFIRDSDLALKIILRFLKNRKMEISQMNIMRQLRQETVTSLF